MKENKNETRIQSFHIDENLIDDFHIQATIDKIGYSEFVNECIRNYVIRTKAIRNEIAGIKSQKNN